MPAVDTPTDATDVVGRRLAAGGLDAFLTVLLYMLLKRFAGGATFVTLTYVIAHYGIIQGATGKSLGKLLCDVKLVDAHGDAPGPAPALIRTAFGLVDYGLILIGVVLMKTTPGHRRLGDAVAGTWVVADSATGRPTDKVAAVPSDAVDFDQLESDMAQPDAAATSNSSALPPAPPLPGATPAPSPSGAAAPKATGTPAAATSDDPDIREGFAAATAALDAVPAVLAQVAAATESGTNVIGTPNPDPATWSPGSVDFEITNQAAASNTISILGAVLETELPAAGPEWDPLRQAYVQWDPAGGRLMQYDYESGVWSPAS